MLNKFFKHEFNVKIFVVVVFTGMSIKRNTWVSIKKKLFQILVQRLKLVDRFTYFGSNISSTETDVNTPFVKVWNAIDELSIIRKSYKKRILSTCSCVHNTIWMHHMDTSKTYWENAKWELYKNVMHCLEQILEAVHH